MAEGRGAGRPLRLLARDVEDLAVISASLQDAIVDAKDITFLSAEGEFVMVANRFKWEVEPAADQAGLEADDGGDDGAPVHWRTHAALRVRGARGVASKGIALEGRTDGARFLDLLAVTWADRRLDLVFAGDATIRVESGEIDLTLQDLGEPWPTRVVPGHAGDAGGDEGGDPDRVRAAESGGGLGEDRSGC